MKQPDSPSVARIFEKLSNIFYLMVGITLLMFAWVYLNLKTISPWSYFQEPVAGPFLHALISIGVIAYTSRAYRKYQNQISELVSNNNNATEPQQIREKAKLFAAVNLPFYFSLTISTVVVVVAFYLSAEEFYIILYSLLLILFSIKRPIPERMVQEMRLKKEEKEALIQALKSPGA